MTGKFASAEAWIASCSSGWLCKSVPSKVTRTSMSGNRTVAVGPAGPDLSAIRYIDG